VARSAPCRPTGRRSRSTGRSASSIGVHRRPTSCCRGDAGHPERQLGWPEFTTWKGNIDIVRREGEKGTMVDSLQAEIATRGAVSRDRKRAGAPGGRVPVAVAFLEVRRSTAIPA
jgi:hypothetical protein